LEPDFVVFEPDYQPLINTYHQAKLSFENKLASGQSLILNKIGQYKRLKERTIKEPKKKILIS
jgi:hypothetical protein